MNYYRKYQTLFQFLALAVFYVVGMDTFLFLKLLGISELQYTTEVQRHSILTVSTVMGLAVALSIGLLELKLFPRWSHFSFRKYSLYKYAVIILTIVGGNTVIYFLFAVTWFGLSAGAALKSIAPFLRSEMFLSVFLYLLLFSIFLNV
ncbi:MAG: hypothetical protein M3342_14555, partial [Bacteroidota bacterium]|nr:hypothetical protein [Bacteroidota bacterium]